MKEGLIAEANSLMSDISMTREGTNNFLTGLKIWIGASSHVQEIINIAKNYREVFEKFGATILSIDKNLGDIAMRRIEDADLILMFAATPGISARALEILFRSRFEKRTIADKLYIYIPEDYASGFICSRFNFYNAKIKHLSKSCFCAENNLLFRKCLYDMCEETLNKRRQKALIESEYAPKIGIITALPVELRSVKHILSNFRTHIILLR